jgi:hypothetical protein
MGDQVCSLVKLTVYMFVYIRSSSEAFNSETSKIVIPAKETAGEGSVLVASQEHHAADKVTRSSLVHSVHTDSGVHPASALSLGLKQPGLESDRSAPSSAELKDGGIIPPFPIRLMVWRFIN